MPEYISVKALTLEELFSGVYVFRLPWFQRAFAWQTEHVAQLLDDLCEELEKHGSSAQYCLGHLLMSKESDAPDSALVDGHQRAMTLTILFCVLRDLERDSSRKAALNGFVGLAGYHLRPQDNLANFCEQFVQADGATMRTPEEDLEDLSDTERNIILNRDYIRERFTKEDITAEFRNSFISFLAKRCFAIVHLAPSEDEAWRRLKKEEETRLRFSDADRAKGSLLSIVPSQERLQCAKCWEEGEHLLGAEDTYALLGHLRLLKRRRNSHKPMVEDLAQAFRLNESGSDFMEQHFLPSARRLHALRRGMIGSKSDGPAIAQACEFMSWVDDQVWVPAALLWFKTREDDGSTAMFFRRLDRLVWFMKLAQLSTDKQITRVLSVVREIDENWPSETMPSLRIERAIKSAALAALRSQTFDSKKKLKMPVLRRVTSIWGQDPGPLDGLNVTIEHILPQGWAAKNDWRRDFPQPEHVREYARRIGNLTFLTGPENNQAASQDLEVKTKIYAESKFEMSRRLKSLKSWNGADIKKRTEELIAVLFEHWEVPVN